MNKIVYLINRRPAQPLIFGHQFDHNDLVIEFQGFKKLQDDSTLYLKIGAPVEALVPLSDDNQITVQNYITKEEAKSIPCQLVEYKLVEGSTTEYELVKNSDMFFGRVLPSLDESKIPEVTDPSLDLIYEEMHEMYLTVKNAYESGAFKGEKGDKGDKPVRGTDYWTNTDKEEIVNDTVETIQPTLVQILATKLEDYYAKSETYSQEEVNDLISKIPKFAIGVVTALPTADISETTIYLLKTSETETDNLYTEYIYVDSKWEMLGTQKLDLSGYYTSTEVDKLIKVEAGERKDADNSLGSTLSDEITRAKAAEGANTTAIKTETDRATKAETALQTGISEEATARENADSALETKISDEVTRAKAAEGTNATAITTETDRATKAETALQTGISEEATARENADSDIIAYLDRCFGIAKPITAKEIAIACRNGNIKSILGIGEAVQFEVGGVKRNFLVMDFIENGQHSSGLKLMDNLQTGVIFQSELVLDSMQFDAKEAFYANAEDMTTGTYNFTLTQYSYYTADVGKTFQFTTTQTIPANSKFVFNANYNVTLVNTTITIYKEDGVTVIETLTLTEGSDGTSLGELKHSKNGNLNASQRTRLGNNNWKESALRQRLNSDSDTTGFWTAQNIWDMPPSWNTSVKGFMSLLSDDLKNNIARVERHTYRNTASDDGGYDTTYDKIWLPSKKEIYMPSESTSDDTEPFAYYKEGSQYTSPSNSADPIRVKTNTNGTINYWWIESPDVGNAYDVRSVYREGASDNNSANGTSGVAPAFTIA